MRHFNISIAVAFALSAAAASAANAAGIEVLLGGQRDGKGRVIFTLRNTTAAPVQILRWQTPLYGIEGNIFDVTQNGRSAPYIGPLYKRTPPTAADYVELKPGQTISVYADLTAAYDLTRGGEYKVRYTPAAQEVVKSAIEAAASGARVTPFDFDRKTYDNVSVLVNPYPARVRESLGSTVSPGAASNTFVGCSADQKTKTALARNGATDYAKKARDYLAANTHGQRYAWWFGAYNAGTNYATVRTHFNKLHTALSTQAYTFDCTCTKANVYAWVYKNDHYRVHLCPVFWRTTDLGTDSRAGTLIHETSHFDVIASTDDWAYGQGAAHSLATSNAARAVDNGDSHEYFGENTPPRN
jgi:peptidyl-Lys metalloendopeptidase